MSEFQKCPRQLTKPCQAAAETFPVALAALI